MPRNGGQWERWRHVPEHPDLVHNVVPVPGRLELLRQQPVQLLAHLDDAPRHRLDISLPLLEQLRVVQDERHLRNARAHTRIASITSAAAAPPNHLSAKRAKKSRHIAEKPLTRRAPWAGGLLISERASTDSWLLIRAAPSFVGDTTCSAPTRSPYSPAFLAKLCQPHQSVSPAQHTTDLAGRPSSGSRARTHLADEHGDAPPDELAHGPGVVVQVAAREALVGTVEERKVALFEHHIRDLAPLFLRRIDARRVVRARVDEEHRARRRALERRDVRVEREPDRLRVVVRVGRHRDADEREDLVVVDCIGASGGVSKGGQTAGRQLTKTW